MGVLAAKQMGAARIIAMNRHKTRQDLALEFARPNAFSAVPIARSVFEKRSGN